MRSAVGLRVGDEDRASLAAWSRSAGVKGRPCPAGADRAAGRGGTASGLLTNSLAHLAVPWIWRETPPTRTGSGNMPKACCTVVAH